jgi:hypothetical protein
LGHVAAAPSGSRREAGHPTGAPLLPKLRGHFAEFLNEGSLDRLGMLYLPTCVGFGTGAFPLPRGFSRGHGLNDFPAFAGRQSPLGRYGLRISLEPALPGCPWTTNATVRLPFPVPPSVIARKTRYRNINLLAIAYAFRPRLRSRLTLSRRTLLRKPWTIGGEDSHLSCATHAGILTSHNSTGSLPRPLQRNGNALLPLELPAGISSS